MKVGLLMKNIIIIEKMKFIMKAKGIDLFSKNVKLNFDKIGDKFSTPYGIVASFFIFVIVGLYSGVRSKILIE